MIDWRLDHPTQTAVHFGFPVYINIHVYLKLLLGFGTCLQFCSIYRYVSDKVYNSNSSNNRSAQIGAVKINDMYIYIYTHDCR